MKTQPECQHHQEIVLDQATKYRRIRPSEEPCMIGDVIVDMRGVFVLGSVQDDTKGRVKAVMTCISTPLRA